MTIMPNDTIPEWAVTEAWRVFGPRPEAVVRTPQRKVMVLSIARALIAAEQRGLERGAEWQPIETAPKDGRAFMVWVANGETAPHCFSPVSITSDGMWWDDAMGEAIEPIRGATHWMPQPEQPEPHHAE